VRGFKVSGHLYSFWSICLKSRTVVVAEGATRCVWG
jgi:hypothetical protein